MVKRKKSIISSSTEDVLLKKKERNQENLYLTQIPISSRFISSSSSSICLEVNTSVLSMLSDIFIIPYDREMSIKRFSMQRIEI